MLFSNIVAGFHVDNDIGRTLGPEGGPAGRPASQRELQFGGTEPPTISSLPIALGVCWLVVGFLILQAI